MKFFDTPFVLILDRTYGADFARKVPSTLPLHKLVAEWIQTDAPFFMFCHGDHHATGRGLSEVELGLGIRAAVEGTAGRQCRWSLAVEDIDGVEDMIRAEALRAAAVAGHG